MNESSRAAVIDEVVREVVARHLDVDVSEIDPLGHLRADLHLDPLDLVLIALRLEDMEQQEFPIHRLEFVETVSDLADVVEAMRDGGFDEAIFTLDHPRFVSSIVPAPRSETRLGERVNDARARSEVRRARSRAEREPAPSARRAASR